MKIKKAKNFKKQILLENNNKLKLDLNIISIHFAIYSFIFMDWINGLNNIFIIFKKRAISHFVFEALFFAI